MTITNKDQNHILSSLIGDKILFNEYEEILEREIVKIGNGAHINIPLKHLGKNARILILRKQEKTK